MRMIVNGDWREIAAADVAGALVELGYGETAVATAVNGRFVPASARAATTVHEGDRLEILAPMQGG